MDSSIADVVYFYSPFISHKNNICDQRNISLPYGEYKV
jgi:hypothetical protein